MPTSQAMRLFPQNGASVSGSRPVERIGIGNQLKRSFTGSNRRTVYLPEGRWIDYWSGDTFDGPKIIVTRAPLDTLPLFIKGGALLPLMPSANRIPEERIDPLIVELHPFGKTTYEFHEDEGITTFTCEEEEKGVVFSWDGVFSRQVIIRLREDRRPIRVRVDEPRDAGLLKDIRQVPDGAWEVHIGSAARAQLHLIFAVQNE